MKSKTNTQHNMCWTPLCANKHRHAVIILGRCKNESTFCSSWYYWLYENGLYCCSV